MTLQLNTLSVTQSAGEVVFTPEIDVIDIKNVGANPVYIQLNDTATTNHFKLEPEDVIQIGLKGIESLSAICDSGKTSTLNIIGN